jgi:hypothetical protein
MASRRAAHHCRRRGNLHARRRGGIMRQESQSSSEGPDDSRQAQQPAKAWKPRKP